MRLKPSATDMNITRTVRNYIYIYMSKNTLIVQEDKSLECLKYLEFSSKLEEFKTRYFLKNLKTKKIVIRNT